MVRGLYTAWTGMRNNQKKLDVISNNVANASTTGYKNQGVTSQSFDDMLGIKVRDRSVNYPMDERIGNMYLGVKIGEEYTDYTQGSLRETGNTFDLALSGDGFFAVEYKNKADETSVRYGRDGSFSLSG
ncbi:MAG: flagellar hook-basal body complex protein [Lachnospiraceae bacterium]|nr:flagellar hook-basal body complex protein [Lachnospiraceae bacterium]